MTKKLIEFFEENMILLTNSCLYHHELNLIAQRRYNIKKMCYMVNLHPGLMSYNDNKVLELIWKGLKEAEILMNNKMLKKLNG